MNLRMSSMRCGFLSCVRANMHHNVQGKCLHIYPEMLIYYRKQTHQRRPDPSEAADIKTIQIQVSSHHKSKHKIHESEDQTAQHIHGQSMGCLCGRQQVGSTTCLFTRSTTWKRTGQEQHMDTKRNQINHARRHHTEELELWGEVATDILRLGYWCCC